MESNANEKDSDIEEVPAASHQTLFKILRHPLIGFKKSID